MTFCRKTMWRYFAGFLTASIVVSAICGAVNPVDSFWVDLGMSVGYAIFVLWAGDGIFLRGIFQDADDVERTATLLSSAPYWRTNLILIGILFGVISTGVTWTLAHYIQSFWVFIVPIVVFGGVLWYLVLKIKRLTNQLAEQDTAGQSATVE